MAGITRSPNYPALGLSTALAYLQVFASKIGPLDVLAVDAAKALGFGGLSGSAKVTLGALNQYGLVVRRRGRVRLSALAQRLLRPEGKEFAADLRLAARNPRLFELVMVYVPSGSDSDIRDYLLGRHGFADRGIRVFLQAYRDTQALVESLMPEAPPAESRPLLAEPVALQLAPVDPEPPSAFGSREVTTLPEGEVTLQWPASLSAASMADLEQWLMFVLGKMKRRYAEAR